MPFFLPCGGPHFPDGKIPAGNRTCSPRLPRYASTPLPAPCSQEAYAQKPPKVKKPRLTPKPIWKTLFSADPRYISVVRPDSYCTPLPAGPAYSFFTPIIYFLAHTLQLPIAFFLNSLPAQLLTVRTVLNDYSHFHFAYDFISFSMDIKRQIYYNATVPYSKHICSF